jgi:cytochrome c nitrite reductase small subunit
MSWAERIEAVLSLAGLSRKWQLAVCVLVGVAIGLALLVARIANAVSYLSDAPEACINCHVMTDAYASWQRGRHARVANCVDCHVPHNNVVAKLAFKGKDGTRHAYVFTMRQEPQTLVLSEAAAPAVQSNCVRCHINQFQMIRLADASERRCWNCHRNIHGRVHGLSSSSRVLRPGLPAAGLDMMKKGKKP